MNRAWTDHANSRICRLNRLVPGRGRGVVGIGISTSYAARLRSNFTPLHMSPAVRRDRARQGSVLDTITTHTYGGGACSRVRDIGETRYAAVPPHTGRYPREQCSLRPPRSAAAEALQRAAGVRSERE